MTDDDGSHPGAGTRAITVAGVPPTIGAVGNNGPVDEAGPVTVIVAAVDAVDPTGTLTYAFDFDNNGTYEVGPQAGNTATHTFPDNGTFVVGVRVTDADGSTATGTTTVTVRNVAPSPTITSVSSVRKEGTAISATGSATDPAGTNDTIALTWAVFKDGATTPLATATGADFTFTPPDNGSYQLVLTAADEDGGSAQATQTIVVTNVDVSFSVGPDADLPAASVGVFSRTIAFTDPGTDTWSGTVSFGDGSGTQALVVDQIGKQFPLAHTYSAEGTYTVVVVLQDDDGNPVTQSFRVTVHLNTPPAVSRTNGTVSVFRGQTATNSGTFADAQGNSTVALTASLGTVTANVAAGTWDWSAPTGSLAVGTQVVTITATDTGGLTAMTTFALTILDPTPINLTLIGPAGAVRGQPSDYSGSATAPTGAGVVTLAWTVLDSTNATIATGTGTAFTFTPTVTGTFTVKMTANTAAGGTATTTKALVVKAVDLQADPLNPGGLVLAIGGTTTADLITLTRGLTANSLLATVTYSTPQGIEILLVSLTQSGSSWDGSVTRTIGSVTISVDPIHVTGGASAVGRFAIYGQAGNDFITVGSELSQAAYLWGGDGNDSVRGGGGNDVVVGGAGDDLLVGQDGRDLLIGGTGADRLTGDAADDILISGYTDYDTNAAALNQVMREWTRTDASATFAVRVAHLDGTQTGSLSTIKLTDTTVHDDGTADTLTGGAGNEWFIYNQDGDGNDAYKDLVTDLSKLEGQSTEDIDFMNGH